MTDIGAAEQQGGKDAAGPVVGILMVGARVGELIGEARLVSNWTPNPPM
jgi:dihydrolipoamide dehydrogenase